MAKKVQGVFTSLVTPFKKDSLKVDFDALMELVSFIGDHGCNGIMPLGFYGEFPSLSLTEKKEILAAIAEVKRDMVFIPNVGSDNFDETLELAHYAQGIKADYLLIMPPYFYKDVEVGGLANYFKKIINTVSTPIYLYNMPRYSGVEISDALIENLIETGKLAGIKDASGDISLAQHFKKKYPQLNLILSSDNLFYEGMNLGITAFSSYLFNAFPEAVKAINFDFVQPKQGGKAAQQYLNEINAIIKEYPKISALKQALTLRGIGESDVRPPLTSLTKEREKALKNSLLPYMTNPTLVS